LDAVRVVEGYAALTMTEANCPDAVVTENAALPLDVQPAKKRIATIAEIPMARHTTPRLLIPKSLRITAILLGLAGRQSRREEVVPGPANKMWNFMERFDSTHPFSTNKYVIGHL
jgi:hypothetical protein